MTAMDGPRLFLAVPLLNLTMQIVSQRLVVVHLEYVLMIVSLLTGLVQYRLFEVIRQYRTRPRHMTLRSLDSRQTSPLQFRLHC